MLRFPIEWKFWYSAMSWGGESSLILNDEWILTSRWKESTGYTLDFIGIQRKTNLEETSICGTFSLVLDNKKVFTKPFSKLISSFPFITKLIEMHADESQPEFRSHNDCYLHGVINIISVSEKCTTDFVTRGCKMFYQPKSLVQLSDDLAQLLDQETSCNADVNLKCGTSSIAAHKLILSARSPVFAAMFNNHMKESHKNEVDITDIDASVLQPMVTYIYSGNTSGLTVASASDLLFASDKYQLLDLKRVCCEFLKESISLQNVMQFVNLGDLHDEDLKSFSLNYLCQKYANFAQFEKIEEWETLRKQKPSLAADVLTSLLKSKDINKKG